MTGPREPWSEHFAPVPYEPPPAFTCPRCGATSHNPNDVREGYCGRCHDWTRVDPGFEPSAAELLLDVDRVLLDCDGVNGEGLSLMCPDHDGWRPGAGDLGHALRLWFEHRAAMHR